MKLVLRLGLFLILISLTLIIARQPFFNTPGGFLVEPYMGNGTISINCFFFTRASSITFSIELPRNVNSTLLFLTTPGEINDYLQNRFPTGVRTSRYSGSFTTTLQIEQRGIHAIVLNFSRPIQSLSLRLFSQGVSESEYTDMLIVLIIGVLLLSSSFFFEKLKPMLAVKKIL
ncbi:MAG: hypothetical protein FGF52_00410 [Candidatus Brockarchaeota archaeon]|nr:hypothetical protein [Candidatus Brockarchaeota archaeon]